MLGEVPPQPARPAAGLRLRAEDTEDLAVISACLQDALVSVRDLAYDRASRAFILVANRFRWEDGAPGKSPSGGRGAPFERILCGLAFGEIDGVAFRGFHRAEEDRILALLAIRPSIAENGWLIDLEFAGRATIRLTGAAIRCHARDLGEPWPTAWQPGHPLDEPS